LSPPVEQLAPPARNDAQVAVVPLTDNEAGLPRSRGSSWPSCGQLPLMRSTKAPLSPVKPSTTTVII
jgi:hypothetical protein